MATGPLLLAALAIVSTSAGGLCAFALRGRLPLVLGFSAGALLGVACFELLPESLALSQRIGGDGRLTLLALGTGVLLFHGLKRLVQLGRATAGDPGVGLLSAVALVGHSFVDGVAIGLAFQVSPAAGFGVAVAVVAHDFCDGLNTVGLVLAHRNTARRAAAMLGLDAVAPLLGVLAAGAFDLPDGVLALGLGLFAGSLLYIAATGLLLPLRAGVGSGDGLGATAFTVAGASLAYGLTRLAG